MDASSCKRDHLLYPFPIPLPSRNMEGRDESPKLLMMVCLFWWPVPLRSCPGAHPESNFIRAKDNPITQDLGTLCQGLGSWPAIREKQCFQYFYHFRNTRALFENLGDRDQYICFAISTTLNGSLPKSHPGLGIEEEEVCRSLVTQERNWEALESTGLMGVQIKT